MRGGEQGTAPAVACRTRASPPGDGRGSPPSGPNEPDGLAGALAPARRGPDSVGSVRGGTGTAGPRPGRVGSRAGFGLVFRPSRGLAGIAADRQGSIRSGGV